MHIVDYFLNRATAGLGIEHLASGSLTLVQAFTLLSNLTQKRNNPNTGFVLLGRSSNLPAHNYTDPHHGQESPFAWLSA